MTNSKLNIKIGPIEFSGEGNQEWLTSQLDKILDRIPNLLKLGPSVTESTSQNGSGSGKFSRSGSGTTLATWLKDKTATTNQNRKFLATAAYLQLGGKDRLTTTEVTGVLKNGNQGRLGNASEALNQNVGKGYCEKDGKSFYVTPEGFKELGITNE